MCSIHIDEPTKGVNYCTVHEAALLNGCLEAGETPVTVTVWRLGDYKFTLHLIPITISHPSLLLALRFFSFLSSANHQWRTRNGSSVSALLLQREVLCLTMQKLHTGAIRISASTGVPIRCLATPPLLTSVRAGQHLGGDPSERPFFACC
jgi:hypothetical protein